MSSVVPTPLPLATARGFARSEGWLLAAILLAGLAHGLLYVLIVPPWQHYDEPSHFEYLALLAKTGRLPRAGEVDLPLRQAIFDSMVAHDFYRGLPQPDRARLEQPVLGLQYSQLDEPPLYYLSAVLPVWLLREQGVTTQMYAARLVSLGWLLLALAAVWGTTRELTPAGSPLRGLVPLSAALLPGFVDVMTAVNNDVAAAAVFSLFLWGSVRVLQRGLSPGGLVWVLGSAALCYWAKSTVLAALPLSVLVIALAAARGRWQRPIRAGLLIAAVLGLFGLFTWQDAAYWYRSTDQREATRLRTPLAPVGDHALVLDASAEVLPTWLRPLFQPLPPEAVASLRGQTVTMGVWMWAAQPDGAASPLVLRTPILTDGKTAFFQTVSVGQTPAFYAFRADIPADAGRFWITLAPLGKETAEVRVFYDGFVLAAGEYPLAVPPAFSGTQGEDGVWGGRAFQNLVRNPSAERVWPSFRSPVERWGARLLPDNAHPSMLLYSVLDSQGAGWYYRATAANLFQTFWARFGWGQVLLIGAASYWLLGIVTALGALGSLLFARQIERLRGDMLAFLVLVLGVMWGAAFLRGAIFIFAPRPFIPVARYAYPAIGPSIFLLSVGWCGLFGLARKFRIPLKLQYVVYLLGFLVLDIVSIISILRFYERI